ncbi:DEAD/DEAH box helicase [Bacillus sp. FJAT-47783]|uniref:DEAD/DEAH box helicase n=1 Tax=Bacillus sp. FJAT-47783 TaxID=2922712 RepID=UPI001FAD0C73|nr:DEAD/DEAH box helicase [Bacillus sp. FJAT-47783]
MTETLPFLTTMKPFLQEVWKKSGFKNPTDIQVKAIPLIIEGKDILAKSPTGTGKTLAYLLPLLEKIDRENKSIQVVILASSHELVMQIHSEIVKWTAGSGISGASFIGGANLKRQIEKLKKRPQIIVGTPGRVHELIKMKKIKMHTVQTIVLDEGDQLLVPEHIHTIQSIVKSTMSDRQILLFSATLNKKTEQSAKEMMNEPILVKSEAVQTKENVEHIYFVCEAREKVDILRRVARIDGLKGLAFENDIGGLDVLAQKLEFKGISVGVLHSELKKEMRAKAIKVFRNGGYPLLLATDVAARGLDIKGLTHVIHVDFPETKAQYVHRSGRTGRLGSESGTVISIVTPREERKLKQFARELNIKVHKKVFVQGKMVDD